jgi:transcriptional regulator with XRE-family HTH domain
MTLQQIADRAGVSRTVVQSWESGTHVPRSDHVMRVTRVLDLDIEDLFHDFEVRSVPRQVSAM